MYASFLRICAPCLRTFYETIAILTFYRFVIHNDILPIADHVKEEEGVMKRTKCLAAELGITGAKYFKDNALN
jgi:hypothetical protein